ncbi:uncharacterized protein [Henckelia pumila]|uniref:uncharacterized protein n=1 Tax=Henckelia pumila TaxID=405737 RepID=UPI003C6E7A9D
MGVKKPVGEYSVDPLTSITAQLSALTMQVAALNKVSVADPAGVSVTIEESHPPEEAQYINPRGYGNYRGHPLPNTYHPGLRNHENISYANKKNVLNPPQRFNTNKGEGKASLEDVVSTFVNESGKRMSRTETRHDSMETHMYSLGAMMKSMETQIGKLTNALKENRGHFPSNTEVNPKEWCKAVELRSGKKLVVEKREVEHEKAKEAEDSVVEEKIVEEEKKESESKPMYKPHLPYPQRFKNKALDEKFSKFLDIFKKIHINIPFADALEQIPNYAKFIKVVMSKKGRLKENEVVKLTEECSAILQKKLPQKLKDPESFTFLCFIVGTRVNRALCDLRASIV